ncbi:LacI family DNA-binding transcriptional regulator [Paenibacillus filicis]|uniref:LacI family DNA-binding transcriptional regulator n=1 Tax=Paenibacillus filicis TaxID=669464 RepID=A0ABU9DQ81_9BACL
MANIDDVAKMAGVSKGTVSNVFSKKRPIGPKVTERVLSVAKELGYYPNHVARSLAIKKTMIIGLKMPLFKKREMSGLEVQMITGVIKECSMLGYRVLLDTLPEHDDVTQFSADPVDGVILLNPRENDVRIERFRQMGIPLVLVGRPEPNLGDISYVDNNNTEMAFQVGDYLLNMGHQSILFLNASSDMTVSKDRENGLSQAFRQRGLELQSDYVINYSRMLHASASEYGYMVVASTYKSLKYTAVIADTDRVALGAMRAARELGLEIPEDLSIIALSNDAALAQETTPRLTSVELEAEQLGAEAAKLVMQMINDSNALSQKIVNTRLIVRESCRAYIGAER